MICPVCREARPGKWSAGRCRRCYQREWRRKHPGYYAEAKRRARRNPATAERDRECSRRWKREHAEVNRARDRERKRLQAS